MALQSTFITFMSSTALVIFILKIILLMFQKVNHTGLDNMRVSK